jgi:hypothetical protein
VKVHVTTAEEAYATGASVGPGWVAQDRYQGWWWFPTKPEIHGNLWDDLSDACISLSVDNTPNHDTWMETLRQVPLAA